MVNPSKSFGIREFVILYVVVFNGLIKPVERLFDDVFFSLRQYAFFYTSKNSYKNYDVSLYIM